jgi:isoamylase
VLQAGRPTHEVALDPVLNRSGDTWHIALPQLDAGLLYGARVYRQS